MRISKKILAAVLAALMVIAMMPFTAFAATFEVNDAESLEAAVANATAGDTITLIADVVVSSPVVIPAGKDVKLNINNHSLSGNIADTDGKKLIQVSGTLEFVGENGGCIYNTNTSGQGHAACQALTGGTVIVNAPITFGDSDEIRDNANATNRGCGIQNNGGTLIINDGYYTAIDANYTTGAWAYAILNCEGDTIVNDATVYGNALHGALGCEEGTLTVNGGTFAVNGANNYYSLYCDGGTITVNGGTFTDNSKYGVNYVGANSATYIKGGTFTYAATTPFVQKSSKANPVVSGGTFSDDVTAYLDESCDQNAGGTVVQAYVAKVGSTKYATLEDAIAAASEGDTITLLADVDLTAYPAKGQHRIDISDTTIDLNGYKITASGRWGVLFEGTNATIKNGTMEAIDNSDAPGYQYGVYVWGQDGANGMPDPAKKAQVTLEDLTINYGIHTYNAEVTVKNCNVTGSSAYYAIWADCESTVNVESGNFTTGGAAVVGTAQYQNTLFGHIYINGGNFVVPAKKKLVQTGSSCVPANTVISGGFYHKADDSVYTVLDVNLANGCIQDTTTGEVIANNDVDTMSITIKDNIDLNIYVADSNDEIETIEFSYNTTPGVEENNQETTVVPATKNADGKIALKVDLAPAQIMDEIKVVAKNAGGETVKTIQTSVADYCNTIINNTGFTQEMKDLAVSTLDYGKAASDYFSYNTAAFNSYVNKLGEADLSGLTQSAVNWYNTNYFAITSVSYVATSTPELRFYIDMTNNTEDYLTGLNGEIETNIGTARFVKDAEGNKMLQIKGIDITDFNERIVVKIKNSNVELLGFTPITWVKMAQNDEHLGDLANAIGNYYLKSVAYFD